ncbi:hypothetical protein ACSBR2_021410 [Camellia fascicularis]
MVVPSPTPFRTKKARAVGIPIIDLSLERSVLSEKIVQACQDYGFFKVVNHGVPMENISRMEKEGSDFFAKPASEKQQQAGGCLVHLVMAAKILASMGMWVSLSIFFFTQTISPFLTYPKLSPLLTQQSSGSSQVL